MIAVKYFGLQTIHKNSENKIEPKDQNMIIDQCEEMTQSLFRVIDTDLYEKGEGDALPEVKFSIEYPILCRTRSDNQLVMTHLADRLQNQLIIGLNDIENSIEYRFVAFLTFIAEYRY